MTPDDGKRDGATNSSLSFPFTFPTRKTTVNRQCCLCSFLSLDLFSLGFFSSVLFFTVPPSPSENSVDFYLIFICFVCVYGPLYFLSMFPSCFVSDLKLTFVTVGLWLSRRHTAIQRLPSGARSEASVKLVAFPSATRQMLTRMGPWVITVGAPALAAFFLENLGENKKKKNGQVDQQHILLRSGSAAFNS